MIPYRPPAVDLRFLGVPPGTTEAGPQGVGEDDNPIIPVAFIPPKISVASAGLLDDGSVDVRDLTAALVMLAVRGAIKLSQGKTQSAADEPMLSATLVDATLAEANHEKNLLTSVFGTTDPGRQVQLAGPSGLATTFDQLRRDLLDEASQAGWYAQMPENGWRGQRSALGRAYEDQVAGFRDYLTTAEADQIKFEEGQDIFSQYLPWAVIFGVADRWTKICAQLVKDGKLPALSPVWYSGEQTQWDVARLLDSLTVMERHTSAAYESSEYQAPSSTGSSGSSTSSWLNSWSSSGTGFGAGSAFGGFHSSGGFSGGGGGFSGGGGGGGGARSW